MKLWLCFHTPLTLVDVRIEPFRCYLSRSLELEVGHQVVNPAAEWRSLVPLTAALKPQFSLSRTKYCRARIWACDVFFWFFLHVQKTVSGTKTCLGTEPAQMGPGQAKSVREGFWTDANHGSRSSDVRWSTQSSGRTWNWPPKRSSCHFS